MRQYSRKSHRRSYLPPGYYPSDYPKRASSRRRKTNPLLHLLILAAIPATIILALNILARATNEENRPSVTTQSYREAVSPSELLEQVRAEGIITSSQTLTTQVQGRYQPDSARPPLAGQASPEKGFYYTYYYSLTLTAMVDLTRVSEENWRVTGQTITLKLPKAVITRGVIGRFEPADPQIETDQRLLSELQIFANGQLNDNKTESQQVKLVRQKAESQLKTVLEQAGYTLKVVN